MGERCHGCFLIRLRRGNKSILTLSTKTTGFIFPRCYPRSSFCAAAWSHRQVTFECSQRNDAGK